MMELVDEVLRPATAATGAASNRTRVATSSSEAVSHEARRGQAVEERRCGLQAMMVLDGVASSMGCGGGATTGMGEVLQPADGEL